MKKLSLILALAIAMSTFAGCGNTQTGDDVSCVIEKADNISGESEVSVEVENTDDSADDEDIFEDVDFEADEEVEYELASFEAGNTDSITVAAPKIKAAYSATATKVTIKWGKVAKAKGYRVYLYDSTAKKWKTLKTITKNTAVSYKVSGLKAGSRYKLKVKAYTKSGSKTVWSKASAVKNVTTKAAAAKPAASAVTTSSAKLGWKKIKCSGIKIQQYASGSWKTVKTLSNTAVSVKLTGLKNGTTYKYRVVTYTNDSAKTKTFNTNSAAVTFTTKKNAETATTTTKTTEAAKTTTTKTTTTKKTEETKTNTTECMHANIQPIYREETIPAWDETVTVKKTSFKCHGCGLFYCDVEEAWNNKDEATLKKLYLTDITDKKVIDNVNKYSLLTVYSDAYDCYTSHCTVCHGGSGWSTNTKKVNEIIHHDAETTLVIDHYYCPDCGMQF